MTKQNSSDTKNAWTGEDWRRIIAIRFGSKILFGQSALDMFKQCEYDQLLSIAEFKLLSRLDLGDKWGQYAEKAPILFELKPNTPIEIRQPRMILHKAI